MILESEVQVPENWDEIVANSDPRLMAGYLKELLRPVFLRLAEDGIQPGDVIRLQVERRRDDGQAAA